MGKAAAGSHTKIQGEANSVVSQVGIWERLESRE